MTGRRYGLAAWLRACERGDASYEAALRLLALIAITGNVLADAALALLVK